MTSLVVRKSSPVVVLPRSEPVTTPDNINLSTYDLYFVGSSSTALLVFQHPIDRPSETIKLGLSQALVHYHPLSGRLCSSGSGEIHMTCAGAGAGGVLFVAASAERAIKDTKFSEQSLVRRAVLDQLFVHYPGHGGRCGDADPLVMMQVTEFSCGGFVVGVTWNHAVADGVGMGQFLQAVGELARGLSSPSVAPVRADDSFAAASASAVTSSSVEAEKEIYRSLELTDNVLLDITITSILINRIKDEFSNNGHGQTCSVFEVICAVLWQCRTRVVMSDPKALTALYFPANARRYAGAKEGYYGNCVTAQIVVVESARVAGGDLMDLVKMVQAAKDQIPANLCLENMPVLLGYNYFCVACWRSLGFERTDFGGGVPERVISVWQHTKALPTCKITSTGKHGARLLSGCVKEEHAEAFLAELARMN